MTLLGLLGVRIYLFMLLLTTTAIYFLHLHSSFHRYTWVCSITAHAQLSFAK